MWGKGKKTSTISLILIKPLLEVLGRGRFHSKCTGREWYHLAQEKIAIRQALLTYIGKIKTVFPLHIQGPCHNPGI